jgi:hypothetical protein
MLSARYLQKSVEPGIYNNSEIRKVDGRNDFEEFDHGFHGFHGWHERLWRTGGTAKYLSTEYKDPSAAKPLLNPDLPAEHAD